MAPEHTIIPEWQEAFQEMLNGEWASHAQFPVGGMEWSLGSSVAPFYLHDFPAVMKLPDEIPRNSPLYSSTATSVGRDLAAGIKHGEISDKVVRAALFVLNDSTGNHGAYSNFSEMLAFAMHKSILSPTQAQAYVEKHAMSCPPCYGDATTVGKVVGLYELNIGHKMRKFPLGKSKRENFFQGAAGKLFVIVKTGGEAEDLETAIYMMDKTINSHNKQVAYLADEMLMQFNKNYLKGQMQIYEAYEKHVGSCRQCGTKRDMVDKATVVSLASLEGRP